MTDKATISAARELLHSTVAQPNGGKEMEFTEGTVVAFMAAFARQVADDEVKAETADLRDRLAEAKDAIRKLDAAMDMQEKRETEEFHIPQHTARDIWDTARQAGREVLTKLQENK